MAASVHCRKQERNFGISIENRKDDDLELFLELENHSMEKNDLLLRGSDDFGDQLGAATKKDRSSIFDTTITVPPRRTGVDAFLNSENDKTDYDWLLTPPETPLFPSLDMEPIKNVINHMAIANGHTTAPESRLVKQPPQSVSKNSETVKPSISSTFSRPLSSGGPKPTASRPATPTGRATLPSTKRPLRPSTPTSRPTLPAIAKPSRSSTPTSRATGPSSTKPSRPNTPTSRTSIPSTTKPSRPNTPTSRASLPSTTKPSRPSTPTSRASLAATAKPNRPTSPTSRPTSRSSTPTRSSSVTKVGPKVVKNPNPSRGISPTVKSRPSKLPEMSKDTPSNLKTTLPDRPSSASRSRPGPPSARSSSTGRTRQNMSAPSNGFQVLAMSRGHSMNGDDVNPGLMGTKMVERVVNMRKLAPPKQSDDVSNNSLGKSMSSQENLGRTLSKTSLDMAMRHMDIRKRVPGNLRPLVTNMPASSVYSVRSGPPKSRTVSSSDSPLATRSNASSEPSVNNGFEVENNDYHNEREKILPITDN